MAFLPEWLQKTLPEPRKQTVVAYDTNTEKYTVKDVSDNIVEYDTLKEAYNSLEEKRSELNLYLDESIPENDGSGLIFEEIPDDETFGLLFLSYTDEDVLKDLEEDYQDFLTLAEKYENDPENFILAHDFVNKHPAFWVRTTTDSQKANWLTDGHVNTHAGRLYLDMVLERDENDEPTGNHYWSIETGEHIAPEYTRRYLDPRLMTKGDTVEEAFVNLAQLIRKFYNNDGTEIPDVPYEKKQWEKDLEESTSDFDA